jgi:hypothetical protein
MITKDQIRERLATNLKTWDMVTADQMETVLCGPPGVTTLYGGRWDSVADDQQRRYRKSILRRAAKMKLIRYRPSYHKWQYIGH